MQGGNLLSVLLPVALFIIMLGMGMSLRRNDFLRLLSHPGQVVAGLSLQMLLLPLLGLIIVIMLNLPPVLAVGLLILTFAPGGATSNMISHLCRADTALSITLTAVTSLLVPFTLPWLTWWAMSHFMGEGVMVTLPLLETAMKLLVVTVVPVSIGMVLNAKYPALCQRLYRPVKAISLLFMFTVVVLITLANREALPQLLPQLSPAILLLACSAMLLAWLIAQRGFRYDASTSLTLAIETGIQNAGTALLVTGAILQQPQMSMTVLLYGILMQLPAVGLIIWRNSPAGVGVGSVNSQ
ncbi:MAG: bile acid:sodium symporter family protein [Amphritea sp.]|nr:bile acid:sodium symporter family protein [Amphritea sp.]